jgi:hypothetical protein
LRSPDDIRENLERLLKPIKVEEAYDPYLFETVLLSLVYDVLNPVRKTPGSFCFEN